MSGPLDTLPAACLSYRETQRLVVSQVSIRRVMKDTVVSDSICDYLLKAGAAVQIPAGVTHLSKVPLGTYYF